MRKEVIGIAAVGMMLLSGCIGADIPVIGLDADGNPGQGFVPTDEYANHLEAAVSTVHDSAVPVLQKHDSQNGWMLREMAFGIGANAQIGIGPWTVGAYPKFRVIFTNMSNPPTP